MKSYEPLLLPSLDKIGMSFRLPRPDREIQVGPYTAVISDSMPKNEIHLRDKDGRTVGVISNIGDDTGG